MKFYLGRTVYKVEFQIPLLMTLISFNFEEFKICPGIYVLIV